MRKLILIQTHQQKIFDYIHKDNYMDIPACQINSIAKYGMEKLYQMFHVPTTRVLFRKGIILR